MSWKEIILLSWKNLTSRKSRSLLTIGGVAIGITAVIFLVSIGYGLQQLAIRDTIQSKSLDFFDAKPGTGTISQFDPDVVSKIKSFNTVKNVYPQLETPAKLSLPNSQTKTDVIAFINDRKFLDQSDLRVTQGRAYDNGKEEVIISTAILKLFNLTADKAMNSKINFTPLVRNSLLLDGQVNLPTLSFTVVGITDNADDAYISVPIAPVEKAIGNFSFTDLKIQVDSTVHVAATRSQVESLGDLQTDYIGDTVAQLNGIFSIVRAVLAAFGLIATFVAALGMFNTLSVSLMERTREIGIMKTLGTTKSDVRRLFLVEGMLISVLGGIFGVILGGLVGFGLNGVYNVVARSTGHSAASFYYMPPTFIALMLGLVVVLGVIVGLFPARRATKISPLEALRYE